MVWTGTRTARALSCAAFLLGSSSCGRDKTSEAPATEPASSSAKPSPPSTEFVAPQTWKSWREGVEPAAPPNLGQETWRAFANQEEPIQRETPVWQPLVADKVVELHMPAGSSYRCIVNPVEVTPQVNDWGTELRGWELMRKLLCSSDGWKTWTEYPHRLLLSVDGTRTVMYAAEAALREQTAAGRVHQTTVLFRSDKEERQATTGPARIVASKGPIDND